MTVPSVNQIRDQIITDYEQELGQAVPILPRAFIRVWATAVSGVLVLVYRFGLWVYRQIFAPTADIEALTRIGEQYNIIRAPAQTAILEALASGIDSTVIPVGTLWQWNGVVYTQTEPATIATGSATIEIETLVAGSAGNAEDTELISLVKPVPGVDSSAQVTATIQSGEDAESIEAYRDRIILRQQQQPQGGAIPDWVAWTLEVPGVTRAVVEKPAPGDITVYALTGTDEATRQPDSGKRAEIETYISDLTRRPLNTETVSVETWTETEFDVTVTNVTPDDAQLRLDIENAIIAYLLDRFPRQYLVENNPKDRITEMDVMALCRDAGAEQAQVVIEKDSTPLPDGAYQLGVDSGIGLGEIAAPGVISVSASV